jgi:hypothetical protein
MALMMVSLEKKNNSFSKHLDSHEKPKDQNVLGEDKEKLKLKKETHTNNLLNTYLKWK